MSRQKRNRRIRLDRGFHRPMTNRRRTNPPKLSRRNRRGRGYRPRRSNFRYLNFRCHGCFRHWTGRSRDPYHHDYPVERRK